MENIFGEEFIEPRNFLHSKNFHTNEALSKGKRIAESIVQGRRMLHHAGNITGGDVKRASMVVDDIGSNINQNVIKGGNEFKRIMDAINLTGGNIDSKISQIKNITSLLDNNGDGYIDDDEVNSAINSRTLKKVSRINPMIARAMKDPNFRLHNVNFPRTEKITDSENLVDTADNNYLYDVNRFNIQ